VNTLLISALLLLLGSSAAEARPNAQALLETQDLTPDEVDRASLRPTDIAWLETPSFSWKHLETEHFILHYQRRMFASKVARLGEQFYDAISDDLPTLEDHVSPNRSHLFIFRDSKDWKRLVQQTPGVDSWAASFVSGQVMYLQEIGKSTSKKMETLAHEMTHLVFNRFLPARLPLWLNEGLAEYYGAFAYRAAKGMGQSKKNIFRPLRKWMPLQTLLEATSYPADPATVTSFYTTSQYLVGFLLIKQPRAKWDEFFGRVLTGEPALPALLDTYGWADIAALEKDFAKFAH